MTRRDRHPSRPYKLITTDNPHQTLGEGRVRHYSTMLAAADGFAKSDAAYKPVISDDGHVARELNEREEALLERVAWMMGYELDEIEG